MQLTQILDERKAEEGILAMEVKARGEGLVPDLDALTDLAPEDFEVTKIDDQGVSVARFADDESHNNKPIRGLKRLLSLSLYRSFSSLCIQSYIAS